MTTTAMPCGQPRRRAGWRSWGSSGSSPGPGSATTTPNRNRCSVRSSTDRTTPDDPSTAIKKPALGRRSSWGGTTAGTATAVRPLTSTVTTPVSMCKGPPASPLPLEPQHTLLASAGSGLYQSSTTEKRHGSSEVSDGRLNGAVGGDIVTGSYRLRMRTQPAS